MKIKSILKLFIFGYICISSITDTRDIRNCNTKQITEVIENKNNMKVLKTGKTNVRSTIHQIDANGNIESHKQKIVATIF